MLFRYSHGKVSTIKLSHKHFPIIRIETSQTIIFLRSKFQIPLRKAGKCGIINPRFKQLSCRYKITITFRQKLIIDTVVKELIMFYIGFIVYLELRGRFKFEMRPIMLSLIHCKRKKKPPNRNDKWRCNLKKVWHFHSVQWMSGMISHSQWNGK